MTDVSDLSTKQLRELDLTWHGPSDDRSLVHWRHGSVGHNVLAYDLDDDELAELNTMIGNGYSMGEIRAWLDERADVFMWQDDF